MRGISECEKDMSSGGSRASGGWQRDVSAGGNSRHLPQDRIQSEVQHYVKLYCAIGSIQ